MVGASVRVHGGSDGAFRQRFVQSAERACGGWGGRGASEAVAATTHDGNFNVLVGLVSNVVGQSSG